jgi:hypothetical protein
MAKLYTNPQGKDVTRHSYSSGSLFEDCNFRYYLDKVKGYKRKDKSAALAFGKAVENALQYFHDNGKKPDTGVDQFKIEWLRSKEADFKYTKTEIDWANLYASGSQLLKLYEIILPTLPIVNPVWQASVAKEVFPGTTLAGIEDLGYLDMISKAPWEHPMLPKVPVPKDSPYRPLVVDVKTSGKPLDIDPRFMALDPQLARYAWQSGIKDIAFLWLVKSSAMAFQKGTEVTFLEKSGKWTPGDSATVWQFNKEAGTLLVCENPRQLEDLFKDISGKGAKDRTDALKVKLLDGGLLTPVPVEAVTKQRIQFAAARISDEDVIAAGNRAAKQIVGIVECSTTGVWPKMPSLRFPKVKCPICDHRGICLGDDKIRDELLVQITPAEPEKDWLDDLEDSE